MTTAREIARRVLRRVRRDRAYANLVLSAELRRAGRLEPAERGLATELVYGVLRNVRLLDHAISRRSSRPPNRIDPDLLDALRVAAYQILFLERIPAYAAVDEAVEAVGQGRGREVGGFANAVLRRLDRGCLGEGLPEDPVARLAVETSLPEWITRLHVEALGLEEAVLLARSLLEPAPLSLRANPLARSVEAPPGTDRSRAAVDLLATRLEATGAKVARGALSPQAVLARGFASPLTSREHLDGLCSLQDEGAQVAGFLLDPRPGEEVLDGCAGLGGKSFHLAELMEDRGEILCVDPSERKLDLLREHALRLGLGSCRPRRADLREIADVADRVLLDAPCSGLGVLRRHPELKGRLSPADLPGLVALQRELLLAAARATRPGGVLVYVVCTTTEDEGPRQVDWLLEREPALRLDAASSPVLAPGPLSSEAARGAIRLWPHRHGCDGFFLARLAKRAP
jgi:16S rRNA (cytosine967-C5)-methyltransferase